MALNLSTLTNPATSGTVLAEALTTADFLDPVPILKNLARGSQKGGDAKQTTALNQPKALPYDGKGYLYLSGVSGNYASVPDAANLNGLTDFVMEAKDVTSDWGVAQEETFFAKYSGGGGYAFVFGRNGSVIWLYALYGGNVTQAAFSHGLTGTATASVRLIRSGTSITAQLDTGAGYVAFGSAETVPALAIDTTVSPIEIGTYNNGANGTEPGKIGQARMWNNATASGTPVLDVDFTATNIRHGDTKFKCATGQVVTINQSGNDPATIIKKSVLRFDGTNNGLQGLLNQTIDGGYMFAAFSVLGNGGLGSGNGSDARLFSVNATGDLDYDPSGFVYGLKYGNNNDLAAYGASAYRWAHNDMYDDDRGDILYETKAKSGGLITKVNNANKFQPTTTLAIASNEFNVGNSTASLSRPAAIDLEYLALFPASITDAEANRVRDFINTRNTVFLRHDTDGYYFFDPQKATFTGNFTGSNTLDGYITGSDLGDTDVRTNLTLEQSTLNDQPSTDGYTITFNDAAEHLEFENAASQTLAGWQVVGTSLGTFAYRVDSDAVTELNLLGNAGAVRSIGDLYGIILLPASATGKDIEDARKLLIDRGASDAVSASSVQQFWQSRNDIVEFKQVDTSSVTSFREGWRFCASLEIFPSLQASNCTNFLNAWEGNSSLNSFGAIDASGGTTFTSAWKSCSALTSFPAGAKLGTAVSGTVTFSSAWKLSGLTSFNTPLPTATTLTSAWQSCTSLTSFSTELPTATRVDYAWWGDNSLSDFRTTDIKNCSNFTSAWQNCSALQSFPAGAKLGTAANNVNFSEAWRSSGLTSFPALDLSQGANFNAAFLGCTSLTTIEEGVLFGTAHATFSVDFGYAFNGCTSLAALPSGLDMSRGDYFNNAWQNCSALTSFPQDAKLGTSAQNVNFTNTWQQSGLTSFSTPLPTAGDTRFAWKECTSLTSFSSELPSATNVSQSWYGCTALTDFSADVFSNWNPSSISTGVFNDTWDGCTSLTAQSVENILTSIDASGKYGTATGAAGGGAIDSGIDIDYDGTTLSAATNAAIDSLSGKGWEVYINGVLVIPNILDLEPAAAYSLRSFDSNANPNVVNVRRSTGGTSDFTASDVSDGTLTSWVNGANPQIMDNPDITSASNWTNGSNTTFNSSTEAFDLANENGLTVRQGKAIAGQTYEVTLVISSFTSGALKIYAGGSQTDPIDSTGTHVIQITAGTSNDIFGINPHAVATASIASFNVIQTTADGHVTTWYDQGGTNHASQTLVSNMPKIVDGGTLVTEGGKPALDINKTPFDLGATISFGDLSWFVVTKKADSGQTDSIIFDGGTSSTYGGDDVDSRGNPMLQSNIIRKDLGNTSASGGEVNQHLSYYNRNGSNASGGLNGEIKTEATVATSAFVLSRFFKYSSASVAYDYVGKAQEIVLFNTDQSANRTGIEKNINDTYTIY